MSLRYAVLGLVARQPASGYDLMQLFRDSLGQVWRATQSQVYGELARLLEQGMVVTGEQGARGRREYAITDAGRAALEEWLVRPPQPNPVRSDLLLHVFLLGGLGPQRSREYLSAVAEQATAQVEAFGALLAARTWDEDSLSVHGRLALEFGLRQARTRGEWAEWACAELAGSDAAGAGGDEARAGGGLAGASGA